MLTARSLRLSLSEISRRTNIPIKWVRREFKWWCNLHGVDMFDYYSTKYGYLAPLDFFAYLLGGGDMSRFGKGPTVKRIDKWIKNLARMTPEEVLDSAVAVRKILLFKNGEWVLEAVQVTLEETMDSIVVADSNGVIEAQVHDQFVTLPLNSYAQRGSKEALKTLKGLLGVLK